MYINRVSIAYQSCISIAYRSYILIAYINRIYIRTAEMYPGVAHCARSSVSTARILRNNATAQQRPSSNPRVQKIRISAQVAAWISPWRVGSGHGWIFEAAEGTGPPARRLLAKPLIQPYRGHRGYTIDIVAGLSWVGKMHLVSLTERLMEKMMLSSDTEDRACNNTRATTL